MRGRRRELNDIGAGNADAVEQGMHGELRVAGGGGAVMRCVVTVAGDRRPGGVVKIGVEAGQHHGAVRQGGDGGQQLGGRRHRTGGAGGDHRRGAGGQPPGLGLDQQVAPFGGLDSVKFVSVAPASSCVRS